jgi:hypothetical protein
MTAFLLIVFSLFALNFVWWAWADAWLPKGRRYAGWRVAVGGLALGMAGLFAFFIYARMRDLDGAVPHVVVMAVYLWHLIVLPGVLVALLGRALVRVVTGLFSRSRSRVVTPAPPQPAIATTGAPGPTRRQLLAASLVAATPPLAQVAAMSSAIGQVGAFRVRQIDVAYHNLPAALDGVTIAHLSDTHFGRFTNRRDVKRIAEATNRLDVDVVAFTGDLIDFDLDDLPLGIDLLKGLTPRHGTVVCEGNHDLFQDRDAFERSVQRASFPLLLNGDHTIAINGHPVQFLGLQWGSAARPRDPMLAQAAEQTLAQRRPDAFGVLLAHHPHAFDFAADAGVPLTLAGHSHGGQLMLTPNLGPGPMMYRYWSGLYRRGDAACVVSNGIGNWFPLRVNAPAEIVHIRLRNA